METTFYTRYTEKGDLIQEITPAMEITALKERLAALEKANGFMREALIAAKDTLEDVKKAANILDYSSVIKYFNIVDSALKASDAAHGMAEAQDAFWESKKR